MNRIQRMVMMAAIAAISLAGCAEPKIPPGPGPEYLDAPQLLDIYGQLAGKTVEFAEESGNKQTEIRVKQTKPLTRAQARELLEDVLRDQAGIVMLHRYHNRVVFGKPMADNAVPELSPIERDLAGSKEDPIAHLVTLLQSAPKQTMNQASITFFPAGRLTSDQVLKDAFNDKVLLSLRRVKSWQILEERPVHNLSYPYTQDREGLTAVAVRTNVGRFVVLLDHYSDSWRATFYRCDLP